MGRLGCGHLAQVERVFCRKLSFEDTGVSADVVDEEDREFDSFGLMGRVREAEHTRQTTAMLSQKEEDDNDDALDRDADREKETDEEEYTEYYQAKGGDKGRDRKTSIAGRG